MADDTQTGIDQSRRNGDAPPRTAGAQTPPVRPGAHLTDYVRLLYRRRRVALVAFVVIFAAAVLRAFTATPVYQGRTQLLIEPENPNVVSFKDVVEPGSPADDYYQTQYAILKSRALAKRTIETLKLWNDPELTAFGAVGTLPAVFDWMASKVSSGDERAPEAAAPGETPAESRVIEAFLRRLTVSPVRNSRLVDVGYVSTSRTVAAAVPNALAEGYIAQIQEFRSSSARSATDWLVSQIDEQRKRVEASEQALQQAREQGGDAVALEDRQNIVVQRLADLNAAVTKARTERIDKEARYNQLMRVKDDPAGLDAYPAILENSFVQTLKIQLADLQRERATLAERLGAKHPDMIKVESAIATTQRRLDTEIARVVQAVTTEYEAARTLENTLVANLEAQKKDALALNRQGISYDVVRREVESNRTVYEALLQRARETGISGELRTSNIRIVDRAGLPRRPVSPDRPMNILLGLFGGLLFGVTLAFVVEYFDLRIKSPDEVERHLGLGVLGFVPGVPKDQVSVDAPLVKDGVPQSIPEMFRIIRNDVAFSMANGSGARTLAITSSQPSEGKSMVASNLAMTIARSGQRVVLLDADLRKPRQHRVFRIRKEPGLARVLSGAAKPSAALRETSVPNLWVIPAGEPPDNPAELLGSPAFHDLLAALQSHFDWVLVDTPPVLLVADAVTVARSMGGVVFVVGSDIVRRDLAARAVAQLTRSQARILGVVLNRVNVSGDPYYYSAYYQRRFQNYYGPEEHAGRLSA